MSTCDTCRKCRCGAPGNTIPLHTTGLLLGYQMTSMKSQKSLNVSELFDLLFKVWGPQHWWPAETPFEVAVGAVLTQNTAWTNVEKAIAQLKAAGALTAPSLLAVPESELAQLIRPAGTCNVKARYLRTLALWLLQRAAGDLSSLASEDSETLRNELLCLRGVGKETADSILLYAVGQPAFVIDAYTLRIASRLHFLPQQTDYDTAQKLLTTQLPADPHVYDECHALLVRLAKERCRALESRCPSAHQVVQKPRPARPLPERKIAS
jgi:endonuclease-3 related protein